MNKGGRLEDTKRQARTRFPTIYPIGHLSDFPNRKEVARKVTNEAPAYNELDPCVYLSRPSGKGPQPPAELFYLIMDNSKPGRRIPMRVYFKEVINDA